MIDSAKHSIGKVALTARNDEGLEKRRGEGKVAITVQSVGGLEQPMDQRFGRSPAFLVVDIPTSDVVEAETNPAVQAAHGAGTAAAAAMQKYGVTDVVSGRFGPKAFQALVAMKINMWIAPEGLTAKQALEKLRGGSLSQATLLEFR